MLSKRLNNIFNVNYFKIYNNNINLYIIWINCCVRGCGTDNNIFQLNKGEYINQIINQLNINNYNDNINELFIIPVINKKYNNNNTI